MPPGHLAFGEVRLVPAVVHRDLLLREIEFDDAGDGARQELPIVTDHHQRRPGLSDELFELLESGQIEIVGRLVEQQDVVAREQ